MCPVSQPGSECVRLIQDMPTRQASTGFPADLNQDRILISDFDSEPLYTVLGAAADFSVSLSPFLSVSAGLQELSKVKLGVWGLAHLAGSAFYICCVQEL